MTIEHVIQERDRLVRQLSALENQVLGIEMAISVLEDTTMTAVNPLSSFFPWKDEHLAKLQELRASGLSASQIATEFCHLYHAYVTRNAIIGKCDRMGIDSPRRRSQQSNGETYKQRQRRWPSTKNRSRSAKKNFSSKLTNLRESLEVEFEGSEACELPEDQSPCAVTLFELAEHHCRWPIMRNGIGLFCGDKRIEVKTLYGNKLHGDQKLMPYCARHCRVAYR